MIETAHMQKKQTYMWSSFLLPTGIDTLPTTHPHHSLKKSVLYTKILIANWSPGHFKT